MQQEPANKIADNSPAFIGNRLPELNTLIQEFNTTLNRWINALDDYDYQQLCKQPIGSSWSLGQVYTHLIEETEFFFNQAETCLASNANASEKMSDEGTSWFLNNSYPAEKLIGPPETQSPPQPESKAQLREDLNKLKTTATILGTEISGNASQGKTKHPGHHFFNATEWFQFTEMHLRHHFRQKERIDAFLKNNNQKI